MNYAYTLSFAPGLGVFGRFAIAMVIIIVLKSINKNEPELDNGLRKLIFIGIATLVVGIVMLLLWFILFGAAFSLPFFGHYYY